MLVLALGAVGAILGFLSVTFVPGQEPSRFVDHSSSSSDDAKHNERDEDVDGDQTVVSLVDGLQFVDMRPV